jgi:hypothetical protein
VSGLFGASVFAGLGLWGIVTGKARTRGGGFIARKKEPIAFWVVTGIYFSGTIAILYMAFFR